MTVKLITYDLNSPGQDYKKLHTVIKSLGDWWHHLDSTWLVDTRTSPNNIVDKIRTETDKNDYLLVLDISGADYQGWLPKDAWAWINKRV